jgi:FkbM family methyltransferase
MSHLLNFTEKLGQLLKNPKMLIFYINWTTSKFCWQKPPTCVFGENIKFSGFTSFSEYWNRYRGIDSEDIQVLDLLSKACNHDPIAIDVGGNLGGFSLYLSLKGFSVHAFEPIAETFNLMQENFRLNPQLATRIHGYPLGCGAQNEVVEFILSKASPQQNKIAPIANQPGNYDKICQCKVVKIDTFLEELNITQVDFLKIDVEGFETQVLKGAEKFLSDGKIKFIYTELIPQAFADAGSSMEEFLQLLSDFGYKPILVDPNSEKFFKELDFNLVPFFLAKSSSRNMLFQYCQ